MQRIKTFIHDHPHMWWGLFLPVYLGIFFTIEHFITDNYWATQLPIDYKIPFLEGFAPIYASWSVLLFILGIYLILKDGEGFRRYMWSIMLTFGFATIFCALVPNGQDLRPAVMEHHNFCTWLLQNTYNLDTNTNVLPGKVMLKIDRRMIPEENPAEVEASIRDVIAKAIADFNTLHGYAGEDAVRLDIKRILLANAMTPLPGNQPLVDTIQRHAEAVFGEKPPAVGTPLYTDVRLYVERGIPGVIYGAGPRSVLESHAKRADERLVLEDLRRATKVVARMLSDLTA